MPRGIKITEKNHFELIEASISHFFDVILMTVLYCKVILIFQLTFYLRTEDNERSFHSYKFK